MGTDGGAEGHSIEAHRSEGARWHDQCLICGSDTLLKLAAYAHAHLVRCGDCGLIFAARIPSDEELARHYQNYGHGWYDSPITRARYRELLDRFEAFRHTNQIFDSGCGAGYFLEEARARGWEVHGSEYSAYALEVTRSKQLRVVEAPITRETYPENFFDVVTAFEVFEHLRDPNGEAAVIAHILRPGGLLYCTTPNFNALSRRLLGPKWSLIEYPEHLCYFTPATIRSWLTRYGFTEESLTSSGIGLARLPTPGDSGDVPAERTAAGTEGLRETIEGSAMLRLSKDIANACLGALGVGDTLKGHFRLDE